MTTVRMIPAHEIVRRTFPRPPPEDRDRIAMAVGKVIDGALADLGYQLRLGRHPTQAGLDAHARSLLEEALAENAVEMPAAEKEATLQRVREVTRAYRRSELAGLSRPKTRVCLIDGKVGVYAQPDFWDGRARVFELKSFRAVPLPPDITLQVRLFQLAFPGFQTVLVCLDRHATPVETTSVVVPAPTAEETGETLRLAFDLGRQFGQEKVLEYVEGPFVLYTLGGGPVLQVSAPSSPEAAG